MQIFSLLRLVFFLVIWAFLFIFSLFFLKATYPQILDWLQPYTQLPVPTFLSEKAFSLSQQLFSFLAGISLIGGFTTFCFRGRLEKAYQNIKSDAFIFLSHLCQRVVLYWQELSFIEKFFLGVLIVVGTAFRYQLAWQPLRGDEGLVFYSFAQKPFWMIPAIYINVGNHIFHTLLLHWSWLFFGDNLFAIRLPVFLAGFLLIPFTYVVVRAYRCKADAFFMTALIASSSALIEYSANSRGYMIQILLTIILFGIALYLRNNFNRFALILWMVFSAFAFWTVPTMLYIYGGLGLWLAVETYSNTLPELRCRQLIHLILWTMGAGVLTLLLYTPALIVNQGIGDMNRMLVGTKSGWGGFVSLLHFTLALWNGWTQNWYVLFTSLAIFGFVAGIVDCCRNQLIKQVEFWVVFWACLSGLLVFQPFVRLWLVFCWFFYLLIVRGFIFIISAMRKKLADSHPVSYAILLVASLWGGSAFINEIYQQHVYSNPADGFQDAVQAAAFLKDRLRDEDLIFATCPTTFPLKYELERKGVSLKFVDKRALYVTNAYFSMNTIKGSEIRKRRVWVVTQPQKYYGIKEIADLLQLHSSPMLVATFPTGLIYEVKDAFL